MNFEYEYEFQIHALRTHVIMEVPAQSEENPLTVFVLPVGRKWMEAFATIRKPVNMPALIGIYGSLVKIKMYQFNLF